MKVCSKVLGNSRNLVVYILWRLLLNSNSFIGSTLLLQSFKSPQVSDESDVVVDESPLVDPEWLEKNSADESVCLIGLGQTYVQYLAAHIPGEVFVNWKTDIISPDDTDQFNLPSKQQFEKLLGRLGITPETTIVLSDNMSSRLSARMFWTLKCYGHEKIKVLNGGRRGWIQSGRDFTTNVPRVSKTRYSVTEENHDIRAELATIQKCIECNRSVVIDSRLEGQYSGEEPGVVFHTGEEIGRRGHIPTALNVAWTENFGDAGRFKSKEELKSIYAQSGISGAEEVVAYCNEGLHAASPWFVLTQILGYENVKMYDPSIGEWAGNHDLPMETGLKENDERLAEIYGW